MSGYWNNELKGSPPRMRGKAMNAGKVTIVTRITPAYAGKSSIFVSVPCPIWDHPRVCGEKLSAIFFCKSVMGSPPRMRGKGRGYTENWYHGRITPAYAGKRLKRSHKIVLFISTPTHFHSVCNRPDITNNNLTALGASVLW